MNRMKTILIIDDETLAIQLLFEAVRPFGRVIFAKTLAAAEELINQRPPDLILLDNLLSDGFGLDFCRLLKLNEITKHIPVIVITGCVDLKEESHFAGAMDFVMKPFVPRELQLLIEQTVNNLGD